MLATVLKIAGNVGKLKAPEEFYLTLASILANIGIYITLNTAK